MHRHFAERKIYTVSEFTSELKALLEESYPFIWISGEISNFKTPASGHFYLTLKDSDAQIQAVMFKGQNRNLKFVPENGMMVTGFGRLSLYPPRGNYQIILEYLEPAGAGALQAAFEQLKRKLADEGLFDAGYKKPLPYLPRKVAVISSSTGSVVHDIIRVIQRRFPNMPIVLLPTAVQGDAAAAEIAAAISLFNRQTDADVAIIARGGGSLEDLVAFNSETVARAIFESEKSIISGVGHETDFTIADFVADKRAPTPSAAAELAVPVKQDVLYTLHVLFRRMQGRISRLLSDNRQVIEKISRRLIHPRRRLDELRIRLDDDYARLVNAMDRFRRGNRERLEWRHDRLLSVPLPNRIAHLRDRLQYLSKRLHAAALKDMNGKKDRLDAFCGRIYALSPAAVLDRGYSIVRSVPEGSVLSDARETDVGREVEIILSKGALNCRVERKQENGKKNI